MRRPLAIGDLKGFTLLEVLVTLAIVALLTVAIPLALPHLAPSQQLRVDADALAAALRSTRDEAVLAGRVVSIAVDTDAAALTSNGNRPIWQAARGMKLSWQPLGADAELRFFPDGSASGGTLQVALANRVRAVDVSPLTGRIEVQTP